MRPRTLILRGGRRIEKFVADLGGRAVLRPLQINGKYAAFRRKSSSEDLERKMEIRRHYNGALENVSLATL